MICAYTTSIRSMAGTAVKVDFMHLGSQVYDQAGRLWTRATIFIGLGAPRTLVIDAKTLFLDRNCTIPMFAGGGK